MREPDLDAERHGAPGGNGVTLKHAADRTGIHGPRQGARAPGCVDRFLGYCYVGV